MSEPEAQAAPDAAPSAAPAASNATPARPGARLSAEEIIQRMDASIPKEPAEDAKSDAATDPAPDASAEVGEEVDEDEGQPSDPDLDKRLEAIQRQEKRSRENNELTRMELLRELDDHKTKFIAEWKPQIEKAQKTHSLFERAKDDPSVLADELDWDAETRIKVAQALWVDGHDKKGDPKFKAQAETMRKDRETRSATSGLQKELAEVKAQLKQQEDDRRIEAASAKALTAIGDKTPVLKSLKPEYVTARLRAATQYMRQQTGQDPDPADVVSKLEQIERQDLLDRVGPEKFASLGFTAPKGATPKTQTQNADKKKPATPEVPQIKKQTLLKRRRSADEILAEMDSLGDDAA